MAIKQPSDSDPADGLWLRPIGIVRSPYHERFAVPRQAGLAEQVPATVELDRSLVTREALRGLDECSHIWLLWWFDRVAATDTASTVRPPRLGGNERLGWLATRSPYRPNPIGLSAVQLRGVDLDERTLSIFGADLVDRTPIFDIKPYLPYADRCDDAKCSWAAEPPESVPVEIATEVHDQLATTPEGRELLVVLRDSLRWDPRPAYRSREADDERVYGVVLAGHEVKFRRRGGAIVVEMVTRVHSS